MASLRNMILGTTAKQRKAGSPSKRRVVAKGPRCGVQGRDWAGRRMSCDLTAGHKGGHKGSHGGLLHKS